MNRHVLLGVNIDHVATLRQARGTKYPDPLKAALDAEEAGADGITLHLREDHRHIQPRDVLIFKEALQTRMNLELAITDAMVAFAEKIAPEHVCFVPEKREEITTEGGLDVVTHYETVVQAVQRLKNVGSEVSLFIDPVYEQIDAAAKAGAFVIELHTGCYADATTPAEAMQELTRIKQAAQYAASLNIIVNAGHGLHYHNVKPIAGIPKMNELNIGHAIVARAMFTGFKDAVREMRQLIQEGQYEAYNN